jgi:hypothetical protein
VEKGEVVTTRSHNPPDSTWARGRLPRWWYSLNSREYNREK